MKIKDHWFAFTILITAFLLYIGAIFDENSYQLIFPGVALLLIGIMFEIYLNIKDANADHLSYKKLISENASKLAFDLLKIKENTFEITEDLKSATKYMGMSSNFIIENHHNVMRLARENYSVKNTRMFYFSNEKKGHNAPIDAASLEKRFEAIHEVTKNGNKWVEIITKNNLRHLNDKIGKFKKNVPDHYEPCIIDDSFPVVNMILFSKDKMNEVWFGFGFFGQNDQPVFRSTHPELCKYFNRYFEELKHKSRPWINFNRSFFAGKWMSVVYDDENDGQIKNFAIIKIEAQSGASKITGQIFSRANKYQYIGSFNSTYFEFCVTGETPIIKFKLKNDLNGDIGAPLDFEGHYNFNSFTNPIKFIGSAESGERKSGAIRGAKIKNDHKFSSESENAALMPKKIIDMISNGDIQETRTLAGHTPFTGEMFEK